MGFCASMSKGWSFIAQAFAMARQDRTLLKPSVYLVLTSIVYFAIWVAVFIGADVSFEGAPGIALGAAATFGSFLIFYFFCGMTVNMVDVHIKGGKPDIREAFRDARQNFGAIALLAVVSTIVELITSALRGDDGDGGGNIAGRIVASIIDSIWTVVTFLLLPAIIIEDVSLGQALRRVRQLHRDHVLLVGVGEVGVRAVTGLIAFVGVLLIVLLVYASFSVLGGTGGVVVAFLVGGTLLSLIAAFNTFVRMAYYTCMYLWAVDVEANGPDTPAPLPLARALDQR